MKTQLLSFLKENTKKPKSNHPQLSLLTVLVPSYCRQDFIVRQCSYWHGSGATVVIMDGSPHPLDLEMQKFINGLGDITYVHSETTLVERLKRCGELVRTSYSVMCGDDDFLLFSGLCRAISLLEQDKDLVACMGQSLSFNFSKNGSKCSYGTGYSTYRYEIRHEDAQDRLNASMTNYEVRTCFAVARSNVWRRSWGNLQECSSGLVFELSHVFSTYISGKLGSIDSVYLMRSGENPANETPDCTRLSTEVWWTSDKYKTEKVKFITKLGAELASAQHIESAKAEAIVIAAMDIYVQDQLKLHAKVLTFRHKCRQIVANRLKNLLPETWVNHLKKLRNHLNPPVFAILNYGYISDLSTTKDNLPFLLNDALIAELSAMEELIADFYLARGNQSK